jgi:hypothetical protein
VLRAVMQYTQYVHFITSIMNYLRDYGVSWGIGWEAIIMHTSVAMIYVKTYLFTYLLTCLLACLLQVAVIIATRTEIYLKLFDR